MSPLNLPIDFQRSLLDFESWPSNSIHRSTNAYPTASDALRSRLDSAELSLCEGDANEWEVPIRDMCTAGGDALKKYNVHNEEKLRSWLGIEVLEDPNDPKRQIVSAKQKDPKCRFM